MRRRDRQRKKADLRHLDEELKRLKRWRDSHKRWTLEGRFLGDLPMVGKHVRFESDVVYQGACRHYVDRRRLATYELP